MLILRGCVVVAELVICDVDADLCNGLGVGRADCAGDGGVGLRSIPSRDTPGTLWLWYRSGLRTATLLRCGMSMLLIIRGVPRRHKITKIAEMVKRPRSK